MVLSLSVWAFAHLFELVAGLDSQLSLLLSNFVFDLSVSKIFHETMDKYLHNSQKVITGRSFITDYILESAPFKMATTPNQL